MLGPVMNQDERLEQLSTLQKRIYRALRNGSPARNEAVELACLLLDVRPGPDLCELVERSPRELTDDRVAELAGRLTATFEPGFELAPERWETLAQALRTVERDLRATAPSLTADVRLIRPDRAQEWDRAYVTYDGGTHGNGIPSVEGTDPDAALEAVADALQETVAELTWTVWPLCPIHQCGLHPGRDAGQHAVWHCRSCGKAVATIGGL